MAAKYSAGVVEKEEFYGWLRPKWRGVQIAPAAVEGCNAAFYCRYGKWRVVYQVSFGVRKESAVEYGSLNEAREAAEVEVSAMEARILLGGKP